MLQYCLKSPIGKLYFVVSEQGLCGIFFNQQDYPLIKKIEKSNPSHKFLQESVEQVEDYFLGRLKKFNLKLNLQGTEFQKKVWRELLKIPYGQTVSYQQIAARIRNPKAVRAVGSANGKNPICVIVPCHRVISADGKIGGYSGGLDKKKKLLSLEGVIPVEN